MRSRVFGKVADVYDRVRPGYPDAVVDDVLGYAQAEPAPALEVGAGTGKATAAFAARSIPVTALEPDAAMAAVLIRQNLPGVTVVGSAFEEYRPPQPFGLVFSAEAWHWTDPAVRWRRAAAALRVRGTLALLWHDDRITDDALMTESFAVHRRYVPDTPPEAFAPLPEDLTTTWPYQELAACAEFGDLAVRSYPWRRALTRADYLALLDTRSVYRIMPEQLRATLFDALGRILPDEVPLALSTSLHLARRLPD